MGAVRTHSRSGIDAVCEAALGGECMGVYIPPESMGHGQSGGRAPARAITALEPSEAGGNKGKGDGTGDQRQVPAG